MTMLPLISALKTFLLVLLYGSKRDIELNVEIGTQARDWNLVQAAEKLKPTEADLKRIEELTDEVQRELRISQDP